jgi:nitrite reductase/ring-hydroxylating ferredoxin subunit
MQGVRVAATADFGDPGRKVFEVGGKEVGVFRLGSELFAYENRCPHLQGPVCQGKILPLAIEQVAADGTSEGPNFSKTQVNIICPWHGFEFDIRTGQHPIDKRAKLRRVTVNVVDGDVYLKL